MSYRDLRNFTEMMRVLGYSRLISLSNFSQPNFPLIAEILIWLVKRYDKDSNVPNVFSTEQERIRLIRYAAEFMVKAANIKLNTKKLYQADTSSVKELLKITNLLYTAQLKVTDLNVYTTESSNSCMRFDISDKINDLKSTKQLASQLTISGACLFDLLGREIELRELRNSKVLSAQFASTDVELAIKEVIGNMKKEIQETKDQTINVKDTEKNLDSRIERRKNELERNQKRLQTLRKVRPAFMEEFEKLEIELKLLYEDYLQKFRYLAYLEHLYEDTAKAQQQKFERRQAATKKQLKKLSIDETNIDSTTDDSTNIQDPLSINEIQKKATETANKDPKKSARITMNQRRIYGSMSGRRRGNISNGVQDANNTNTSDSDSDLLIDNLDDDDDDDDDLLNSIIGTGNEEFTVVKHNDEKRAISKIDHTDDEF